MNDSPEYLKGWDDANIFFKFNLSNDFMCLMFETMKDINKTASICTSEYMAGFASRINEDKRE